MSLTNANRLLPVFFKIKTLTAKYLEGPQRGLFRKNAQCDQSPGLPFSTPPDKCQPLFGGKQHCARLNAPRSISVCFSHAPQNDICISCTCILLATSSLSSLSRGQTLFSRRRCNPSLSPHTPPLAPSLSPFLLIVLNLFIALHLLQSPSFFSRCLAHSFSTHFFFSGFLRSVFSSSSAPY